MRIRTSCTFHMEHPNLQNLPAAPNGRQRTARRAAGVVTAGVRAHLGLEGQVRRQYARLLKARRSILERCQCQILRRRQRSISKRPRNPKLGLEKGTLVRDGSQRLQLLCPESGRLVDTMIRLRGGSRLPSHLTRTLGKNNFTRVVKIF